MHWIKRTLRAFVAPVSPTRPRVRLGFEALEDRTVPTALGVIAGNVFFDYNGNTLKDGSDTAVIGATIKLTGTTAAGNAVQFSTTTTSNGTFQFLKLEAGTYQVSAASSAFPNAIGVAGNLGGDAVGNKVQSIVLPQGQIESGIRFAVSGATLDPQSYSLRLFLNNNIADPSIGQPNKIYTSFVSTLINKSTAGTGMIFADGVTVGAALTGTASIEGNVLKNGTTTGISGVSVRLVGINDSGVPVQFSTTTDSAGHYKFSNLPAAAFFIDLLPGVGFRAVSSSVGSLGGSSTRADQLATTRLVAGNAATGYNFNMVAFTGALDAGLANDVANGSLGTASDGITSDPSIIGRLVNPSAYQALDARFTAGATTAFVSVKSSLAPDGSFVLNPQTLRDVFGGGIPDGAYTVQIRATSNTGAILTKSVSFTLKTNGPTFLSAFGNITNPAATANTTLLLAGAFTDPNITDSSVTFKALKGTTPVDINVELFDKDAPGTVANFFNYLDRYAANGGTIFHRLHKETGLNVLQGGGYNFTDATDTISAHITQDPTIRNEFSMDRPNDDGTLALAKLGGDANSGTSEFFFNLDDANASTLGVNNNGGFAVFGKVASAADLAALNSLSSVPIKNVSNFSELPLVDGSTLDANNIERIQSIVVNNRDNELTYSVTSSNTAAATVSTGGFQGNQLTIDYVAAGTSTITVTATDKTGNTATTTFLVTVT